MATTGAARDETTAQRPTVVSEPDYLLRVRGLRKHFPVRRGFLQRTIGYIKAVDGVDMEVRQGETLGLVGESGCGKSTLGRSVLRLIEPSEGTIEFDGKDITHIRTRAMKAVRADMQMIFQDPIGSLNPRMSVGDIVGEGLLVHGIRRRRQRENTVREVLLRVGLRPEYLNRYPHEFSGGQRQPIGIARPLARAKGTQNGICADQEPPLKEWQAGHLAACHFAGETA